MKRALRITVWVYLIGAVIFEGWLLYAVYMTDTFRWVHGPTGAVNMAVLLKMSVWSLFWPAMLVLAVLQMTGLLTIE